MDEINFEALDSSVNEDTTTTTTPSDNASDSNIPTTSDGQNNQDGQDNIGNNAEEKDFDKLEKKNPILSEKMQKLLNNSHQELDSGDLYDNIGSFKYIIMDLLTKNEDLLHTLHNKEIEEEINKSIISSGDKYRYVNIFDFMKVPDTQSIVKNFICFEVNETEDSRYSRTVKRNECMSIYNIMFRTISHENDYITDYGIARQDLLGAIIKSEFDWTNIFGLHVKKVYDKGRVAENGYYYREFIYECLSPNNIINKNENEGITYGDKRRYYEQI